MSGLLFCLLQIFPTGDGQGKLVARHQPAALAAMEGKFETGTHAELAIIGQPDVKRRQLENPIVAPGILSFLAYGSFGAKVKGLNDYPAQISGRTTSSFSTTPTTSWSASARSSFVLMGVAAFLQWRGKLEASRPLLWMLMLAFPFPYIATTAGWMTAELGRQPWLIYGLQRTIHGTSPQVSGGNVAFSTLGFMGLYLVMGVLFLYLVLRTVANGPELAKTDTAQK